MLAGHYRALIDAAPKPPNWRPKSGSANEIKRSITKPEYRIVVLPDTVLTRPSRILERLVVTRFLFWHLQYWETVATCDVDNIDQHMKWLKQLNVVLVKLRPHGYNPALSIHEVKVLPYCWYKISIHATSQADSEAFLYRRILGLWFVVAYSPSAPNEATIAKADSWQTDFKVPEYCVTFKKHWSWTNNSDFPMPTPNLKTSTSPLKGK